MVSKIKWDIPVHTGSLTPFPVMQAAMQDRHSPSSPGPLLGNTHGPWAIICSGCSNLQLQVKPPWGTPVSAPQRHGPLIWKESPHQCRTQTNPNTTPCSSPSSGQVSDESLLGAALAFFTAQMSARDGGENTGFLAFLLLFPAEITVARANISTVTQLASTILCRGRRKKRISIGEKKICNTSLVSQVTRAKVKAHT